MKQAGVDPHLVTIYDAAKRLGVHYRTVESMIDQGCIDTVAGFNGRTPAKLIPISQLAPKLGRVKLLECRVAVETTGLPKHVLADLRATGEMEHSNKGIRIDSFAEADVLELIDRWRQLQKERIPSKVATTRFQEVLRRGNEPYRTAWKAELVRRILNGRIRVSDRSAPPLEATLRVSDVIAVPQEFAKDLLTLGDAAAACALPIQGVLEIVAKGLVPASVLRDKVRIRVADMQNFSATYIRLASLRKWYEEDLANLCALNAIPLFDIAGRSGRCRFLHRAYVPQLVALAATGAALRKSVRHQAST